LNRIACLIALVALPVWAGCSGAGALVGEPDGGRNPAAANGTAADAGAATAATTSALATAFLRGCKAEACGFRLDPGVKVDTVIVNPDGSYQIGLNDAFAQEPSRESVVLEVYDGLRNAVGAPISVITSLGQPIEELVPNHLRKSLPLNLDRRPTRPPSPAPIVQFPDGPAPPTRGLFGRHVALWASHGWYYEPALDRWEWQRARLFTTVEDVLPTSFVLPYLAPMLERAGAHVWMPRERDPQPAMVVVDNDDPGVTTGAASQPADADAEAGSGSGSYAETCPWQGGGAGFASGRSPYGPDDRPWEAGTHRWISATEEHCGASWHTELPEPGRYAVYVSHGAHERATRTADYTIRHAGGNSRILVDQTMGAGTWIYAGTYQFSGPAKVTVSTAGSDGSVVSADAVRFGGGTGVIARNGRTSGRPRWLEGARYALQFDGMPASLVYNVTDQPEADYVDDYRNRGEWVNYLRGAPLGPNKDPSHPGLGIPIDLSLAFHTDAGITPDQGSIGTLSIYSSRGYGPDGKEARVFNDGTSRFANRDLADRVQAQVVADIRALHDSTWTRRSLWDRDYSEAYRPNVPSMLLELLSHQNFADMRLGLDPRFRFDVSRAIYKAMLRFVAAQYGEEEPVVAPLAPRGLLAMGSAVEGTVLLTWEGVSDPLEPTARPTSFRVYVRNGSGGFDNGTTVSGTTFSARLDSVWAGFKVTAVNEGGESAPSEVVGASIGAGKRVLVVSAFDRIGPPAAVDIAQWRGFPEFMDHGVPDGVELSYVGAQHDLDSRSPWVDDDEPGHGASHADLETRTEVGNTFDYAPAIGHDFMQSLQFDTVSDETLGTGRVSPDAYALVYVQLGEERASVPGHPDSPEFLPFPKRVQRWLAGAQETGVPLFISGSYPTEELSRGGEDDQRFAETVLGARHRSDRASRTGEVEGILGAFEGLRMAFNTSRRSDIYEVESPEALIPAGNGGHTVLRYTENNMSAGVLSGSVLTLGFPLETIRDPATRRALIQAALRALGISP
jgi:hypothetical protein